MSYQGDPLPLERFAQNLIPAARQAGFREHVIGEHEPLHLIALERVSQEPLGTVYISAGIHGDEPAGPLALLALLETQALDPDFSYVVFPLLNPQGAETKSRENRLGVDLNRDYRESRSYEVKCHVQWIEEQLGKVDMALHLHEDWESPGFYLFELLGAGCPSLAGPILETAGKLCPINEAAEIEEFPASGGLIRPQVNAEERPDWPEAIYLRERGIPRDYTVETPSMRALEERIAVQASCVRAAIAGLRAELTGAQGPRG